MTIGRWSKSRVIELSVAEVANTLQAQITGDLEAQPCFPSVSIDSRTLEPGQCYIAIKGKRLDGHDFLEEALRRGASLVIHSDSGGELSSWKDRVFMQVDDTTAALQNLAHFARKKWNRSVLAITGSMGKTTTREFVATLLGQKFRVFQSPGNLNNEIGVPLSLLQLSEEDQMAVLELGMSHPGEIRLLSSLSRPDSALLTNVAAVHLEFFSDLDAIAAAKGEILEHLSQGGRLFFNADDDRVTRLVSSYTGPKISFGLHQGADIQVSDYQIEGLDRMNFGIESARFDFRATVPFAGRHLLYNVAAAVAVAYSFDLSQDELLQGISRFKVPSMRGQIHRIGNPGNQITLWDDCYNSNPEGLGMVLETVSRLEGFRHKILALGDMLELGPAGPDFHYQAGRQIAQSDADSLVTVGDGSLEIDRGAREAGFPAEHIEHFKVAEEAAAFLAGQVVPGDLVLVKGSRRVAMDRIIRHITGRRESA